jgi:hypothetical protein
MRDFFVKWRRLVVFSSVAVVWVGVLLYFGVSPDRAGEKRRNACTAQCKPLVGVLEGEKYVGPSWKTNEINSTCVCR